jgi:cyclic pyranopterin phosphate synthase
MGKLSMTSQLIDAFGREHTDLRVSLTDKCNLRCTYCMPAEGVEWLPSQHILTAEEITKIISILCDLGIKEVRLTGGEPLLRPDIIEIISSISKLENAPEISLTTNGIKLASIANDLAKAGLKRINISLDTLQKDRFKLLSRRDGLDDVLRGIDAAILAGLKPIKINSVLMPGINDDEAVELVHWAMGLNLQLRFIEQMPLDAQHSWSRKSMITATQIKEKLSDKYVLKQLGDRGSDPAELYEIVGTDQTVGIIASVTKPFCSACDRLRLTADGQLRNCLFSLEESDLRTPLRQNRSKEELTLQITACVKAKKAGHGIGEPTFVQPPRPMSAIGG